MATVKQIRNQITLNKLTAREAQTAAERLVRKSGGRLAIGKARKNIQKAQNDREARLEKRLTAAKKKAKK